MSGSDKKWYAFRVTEFVTYMTKEYGAPKLVSVGLAGSRQPAQQHFPVRGGIIAFEVAGWSNATGHFDLWDGLKCIHEAYFDKASKVMLWEAPA